MQTNNIRQRLHENELHDDLIDVKEKLQDVKDSLQKTVVNAKQNSEKKVTRSLKKLTVQSLELDRSITSYIKDHPRKAIGFAIAAGALIAKII